MKTNRDILAKFISTQGYKRNSPDKNRPFNIIPSGDITMQDVDFPVYGVDNLGNEQLMMPGAEYTFPGDYVVETPAMQSGGTRPPIFTSNPRDPRIQSYNDSLNLYNKEKKLYEDETTLNYDNLLKYPASNPNGPKYGYTFSGKPLYGYKKPVQPVKFRKVEKTKPTEPTTPVETPVTTTVEPTPTPVVERKVVSISPEEVKAGTKTTSGKQIGSGTAGGRIYRVKYDNGETEILNEFEYRSRGLKMQDGGQTGWLDEYQAGGPQMYPAPSLEFQKRVQDNIRTNSAQPGFVRREPVTVSQSDNTRTNAVEDAKRTVESYSKEDIKYFLDNNIPKERWGIEKVKMQEQAVLRAREAARNQSREDVKNNPFAITKATNENLRNEFRAFPNDANSFFDEYLNPAQMIGNLAANLGDNFTGEQPIDPWKLATDVVTPAFVGMTAGIGAQNTGQFVNNLINPLAGIKNPLARRSSNAEIINERMTPSAYPEGTPLNEFGRPITNPNELDRLNRLTQRMQERATLSAPPSEIRIDPDLFDWEAYRNTSWNTYGNSSSWAKPKAVNKSGLTLEQTLEKVAAKDKDTVSKMSETEFENTVLKPDGQLAEYKPDPLVEQMMFDRTTGRNILKDQTVLSEAEYADAFNSQLDLLNSIIKRRNKSGVEYRVKGLNPNTGTLQFETPPQSIPSTISPRAQERINRFYNNPEEFLKNEAGLFQEGNVWRFPDEVGGDTFNSMEEAVQFTRKELEDIAKPTTISGESTWGIKLNPGKWRGNVEDLPNTEYLRSIPGIEMSNTTAGVFSDRVARKGTGAYESINEYLKTLDLGRVKPGFNSQTDYSRGAWENFIKSGRGVGFYANPRTVYGTMKTLAPIGVGVGVGASLNTRKTGGQTNWLDEYE